MGRHRAFGPGTSWWAIIARTVTLVLALAIALPAGGLAEDLAFHEAHDGHGRTELAMAADGGHGTVDPGVGCHIHCGCHIAGVPCEAGFEPPPASPRARYGRQRDTVSSIMPDRLPRPPRV